MSSTELLEAASISITSSELAAAIDTHDSHVPQGSTVGPRPQFRHAARIFAIEVLPVTAPMQRLGAPPGMRFRALAASARVRVPLGSVLAVGAGAVALRLISGVGFANYDTLYALAWGGQLSRGQAPTYDVPIAPTPH